VSKNKQKTPETTPEEISSTRNILATILAKNSTTVEINEQTSRALRLALGIIDSYLYLLNLLGGKTTTIKKLKRLIFGNKSEKSKKGDDNSGGGGQGNSGNSSSGPMISGEGSTGPNNPPLGGENRTQGVNPNNVGEQKKKKKRTGGNGRHGHDDYTGATVIKCPLCETEMPGAICPACGEHKLYSLPSISSIRLIGAAPVLGVKFEQDRSGCVCGAIFYGKAPAGYEDLFTDKKYTPSALSSMLHQKYDLGVPFGALSTYQSKFGIPLPASTQANKINDCLAPIEAIFNELIRLGANMDCIGFDDTPIKILEGRITEEGNKSLKGHGSVFICKNIDRDQAIVLFFLDFNHAGKSFLKILQKRQQDCPPLICICDGLPSYESYVEEDNIIGCNCNVHARRQFFDHDPKEEDLYCSLIVGQYRTVYKNEKFCVEQKMSAVQRQEYHAANSTKAMETIEAVCQLITESPDSPNVNILREQLKLPEYAGPSAPNSDLYGYADYVLSRWTNLTNFLTVPGVPLDTNYVERMVKAIIDVRKKSFFFKTVKSAQDAGKVMSVIETATISGADSNDFMKFVLEHPQEVIESPGLFLPWNYQAHHLYKVKQPFAILPGMMPPGGPRSSRGLVTLSDSS